MPKWFDITVKRETDFDEKIVSIFKALGGRYAIAKEIGGSGYKHYQIRIRLEKGLHINDLVKYLNDAGLKGLYNASVTSNKGRNWDYILKDNEGVMCNFHYNKPEEPDEIPQWWQQILDLPNDERGVYCLVDARGGIGKSAFCRWIDTNGDGVSIPFVNNSEQLMQCVFGELENGSNTNFIIVDMPRESETTQLLWNAIESIKNGLIYERRYKYRKMWINRPKILVFTNEMPNEHALSKDRWRWLVYLREFESIAQTNYEQCENKYLEEIE